MKVLVLGAGPAGLAAAIRLKERGGRGVDVQLLTQGHLFGGKASTHRDRDGRTWEHGFHVFFGFYTTLWGLLRRARVDLRSVFARNRGWTHFARPDGGFDSLKLSVNPLVTWWRFSHGPGLDRRDRLSMIRFALRWGTARAVDPGIAQLDDVCFRVWAGHMGLSARVRDSPRFRFTIEGYFNDPHPISAYVAMRSIQLLSSDARAAEYYYQRVGLSEGVWEPLAAYFERLGGTITPKTKVTGLTLRGDRVVAVEVASPDERVHGCGGPWGERVAVRPETRGTLEDFDAVVCALPRPCLIESGPALLERAGLAGIDQLREVVTLSLQAFYAQALPCPRWGAVNGLGAPLPMVIDYQQIGGRWQVSPGATLSWCGQLAGFEDRSDDELLAGAVAAAARGGFRGVDRQQPVAWAVRRNSSGYDRFTLTEPGALRYRPRSDVGLENLFLAGDWVRNRIDVPCMEGAAVSGFEAADHVLGLA